MLMYHPDTEHLGDGSRYHKGWLGRYAPTAGEVAQLITQYAVSPCMWGSGIRKKANFRFAEWFALDFDDGMTLEEAKETFQPFMHVIGTTKSHQKDKRGVVCDRFRVLLKFAKRCTSRDDYEATARYLVRKYKADTACVDAGRFFWPCKDIAVSKYYGKVIGIVDSSAEKEKREKFVKRREQSWKTLYPQGQIPAHVQNKLQFGVVAGKRNVTCFGIGADLASLGFSESEIISLIQSSAILSNDFTLTEAQKAVRSGMRKSKTPQGQ